MKIEIENFTGTANSSQLSGTVKWFNNVKGYGFIKHTSGKDVFVHYSVIADEGFKTLNEGDEVLYELDERVKGLYAKKVELRQQELISNSPDKEIDIENVMP